MEAKPSNGNATVMALLKNPAVLILLAAMFGGGAAGRHILGDGGTVPAGHAALQDLAQRVTAVEVALTALQVSSKDAMPRALGEQAFEGIKDGMADIKDDIKDLSRKIDAIVRTP